MGPTGCGSRPRDPLRSTADFVPEPTPATLKLWPGGTRLEIRLPTRTTSYPGGPGGPRGGVREFSAASRRRLVATLGKIPPHRRPVFLTLTYPRVWPSDSQQWKRHLHIFRRRLDRISPQSSYIWKLEPQRRGAPHYHLLLYNAYLSKEWYKSAWHEAVQPPSDYSEHHWDQGAKIETPRNAGHIRSYVAKYICKHASDGVYRVVECEQDPEWIGDRRHLVGPVTSWNWSAPGRFWGVTNRRNLLQPQRTAYLSDAEAHELRRWLQRLASRLPPQRASFTIGHNALYPETPNRFLHEVMTKRSTTSATPAELQDLISKIEEASNSLRQAHGLSAKIASDTIDAKGVLHVPEEIYTAGNKIHMAAVLLATAGRQLGTLVD